MFFVIQIKRNAQTGSYANNIITKDSEVEAYKYVYACMSTYAYKGEFDYIACHVMTESGSIIKSEIADARVTESVEG